MDAGTIALTIIGIVAGLLVLGWVATIVMGAFPYDHR